MPLSKVKPLTWLKVAIFLLVMGGVVYQLVVVQKLQTLVTSWRTISTESSLFLIGLTAFLMPLNWFLETVKWRVSLHDVQRISLSSAFKAVISGVSLGLFTPNRIGEYGARIFVLQKGRRLSGIVASLLSSFAQIVTTVFFGCLALVLWVLTNPGAPDQSWLIVAGSSVLAICTLGLYFNIHEVYRSLSSLKQSKNRSRWLTPLRVLHRFDGPRSGTVLLWATLRYLVYAVQYLLLLYAVGLPLTILEGMQAISIMYLVQMLIPVPAIGELGVRTLLAEPIFYQIHDPTGPVFIASATLWLVNLFLPGTVGAFLFVSLKPTKKI